MVPVGVPFPASRLLYHPNHPLAVAGFPSGDEAGEALPSRPTSSLKARRALGGGSHGRDDDGPEEGDGEDRRQGGRPSVLVTKNAGITALTRSHRHVRP